MNKRTMTIRPRSTDTPHPMMEEFIASSPPQPSNTTSKAAASAGDAPPLPTHSDTDPSNPPNLPNDPDPDPYPPRKPKPNIPKTRPHVPAHSSTKLDSSTTAHNEDIDPTTLSTPEGASTGPPPPPRPAFAKPIISALAASAVLAAMEVTPGSGSNKRKAGDMMDAVELVVGRTTLSGENDDPPPRGDPDPPPRGDPDPPPAGPPPEVWSEKEGERERQGPGCPGPRPTKPLPPDPPR